MESRRGCQIPGFTGSCELLAWVLRTKFRSFARVKCAFNCCAALPNCFLCIFGDRISPYIPDQPQIHRTPCFSPPSAKIAGVHNHARLPCPPTRPPEIFASRLGNVSTESHWLQGWTSRPALVLRPPGGSRHQEKDGLPRTDAR